MEEKRDMIQQDIQAELVGVETLCKNSIELIQYARRLAVKQVNLVQLMTYYTIGRWIVEEQQHGTSRAQYGAQVISKLSVALTEKFGRGFSKANLEFARKFYLTYQDRIAETVFRQFAVEKTETLFRQFGEDVPFSVSWSHYLILMRISNADERNFEQLERERAGKAVRQFPVRKAASEHKQRKGHADVQERTKLRDSNRCDKGSLCIGVFGVEGAAGIHGIRTGEQDYRPPAGISDGNG